MQNKISLSLGSDLEMVLHRNPRFLKSMLMFDVEKERFLWFSILGLQPILD